MLKFTTAQIAEYLGGSVEGDPTILISDIGRIEGGEAHQLSFLSNMAYESHLYTTRCGAVLVNHDFVPSQSYTTTLIRVSDAYGALAQLLQLKEQALRPTPGVSPLAVVDPTAEIDPTAYVAPLAVIAAGAQVGPRALVFEGAYIGHQAMIGEGSTIYQNATICAECHVGRECIVHSGAVIGADGFGFAPTEQGYNKIPQNGNVVLEDRVEIGANACIDRAVTGSTIVREGVKIDNLVQIAHNSEVGAHTVMAAQSGIAGSTKVGRWNRIGGQVGVAGHLTTADNVTLAAQTGVISSIKEEGATLFGSPAQPHMRGMRAAAVYIHLPEMRRELDELRKEVAALKAALASQSS